MRFSSMLYSLIIGTVLVVAPSFAFASYDTNLSFGSHGSAVVSLQQFLISQGLLESNLATGYFGNLTIQAVKAFQTNQDVSPVSGFFGPLTRAKANALSSSLSTAAVPQTTSQIQLFSAFPTYSSSRPVPLSFTFYSDTSYCNTLNCSANYYSVDFGDGSSSSPAHLFYGCDGSRRDGNCAIQIATHAYASSGTYTAKLRQCTSAVDTVCSNVESSIDVLVH